MLVYMYLHKLVVDNFFALDNVSKTFALLQCVKEKCCDLKNNQNCMITWRDFAEIDL